MPGAMRTCSMPSSTSVGHRRSASWHAANSAPSDTSGAALFAAAIAFAYLTDSIGVRIRPAVTLVAAAAASVATFRLMHRAGIAHRSAAASVAAIVAATFGWLLWLARPELLPIGSGPDLV